MSHGSKISRGLALLATWSVAAGLTGCGASSTIDSNGITFTNVSSSWLNVDFFVADRTAIEPEQPVHLVGGDAIQVRPGRTVNYALPDYDQRHDAFAPLVHLRVRAVKPSWEVAGTEYWMELLTHPPVTIVATGTEDRVEFMTGDGALAMIPAAMIWNGAFVYDDRRQIGTETQDPLTAPERRAEVDDSTPP